MKFACALMATLFAAAPVLAAETASLPADVSSYLARDRQTAACQPKHLPGLSIEQIVDNFIIARWSAACAPLERERKALIERYKDNKDVVDALALKVGTRGDAI
jgi:hypothetical protein